MSLDPNSFAIAAVTATMTYILKKEGGITVTTKPPDTATDTTARLNIFLYQVTPNLGYRNNDMPSRSYSGELVHKQQLGIDLHYLLTAYGNQDDELSSQWTLAKAIRVLHENPVFTRDLIVEAINESDFPDIEKSDLAKQLELVKLTMQSLSLEDLTKIWSAFFKTGSYRISVAYKATVVLLNGKEEPRSTPMPVSKVNSYVYPFRTPVITYIKPQIVPWTSGGTEIKIVGGNLKADIVKIDFGEGLDAEDMPEPTSASTGELTVAIPDTVAAPGIKQVRVLHPLSIGTPEALHKGLESNKALFAIVPVITAVNPSSVVVGAKLTIKFEPSINLEKQDVKVIISTYKPLKVESATANPTTDTVQVTIPDADYATNKDLPVRLIVDSAESQPDEQKWNNEFKRPVVKII